MSISPGENGAGHYGLLARVRSRMMIALRNFWPRERIGRPWLDNYPEGVPAHLSYPEEPLDWLLEQSARRFPQRVACRYYSQQLTYDELLAAARRLAQALVEEGLKPGDRVGVLLPNIPECLVALFGTWMAGGVVLSLSPLMVADDVAALLKSADCRIVVTLDVLSQPVCAGEHRPEVVFLASLKDRLSRLEQWGYAWVRFQRIGFGAACARLKVRELADVLAGGESRFSPVRSDIHAPAFILPTGGTTGSPKAVVLSHRNLVANAWQLSHWAGHNVGAETILGVLPFFHSYGLSTCVTTGVAIAATIVLHHRFRPETTARLIEQYRPTLFPAVPAMLAALNSKVLNKRRYDLSSLRCCISGGAALPPKVADEFAGHARCAIVEGYGLSEASPVTHAGPLDGTAIPGSIGLPLPDTDARVVDVATGTETLPCGEVGELVVRGPQVMRGYWNNEAETASVLRGGWLYTGDLATCDERGFFRIVDRKKDLIITSGFNVYPADVEEVLRTYPGVRDAAVIGVPDDEAGELVKAVLVLKDGKFNRKQFDEFVRTKLSAQKRPKLVDVRTDDLPRNFLGKVLRRELRDGRASSETPVVAATR